jgi:hypothetical protein
MPISELNWFPVMPRSSSKPCSLAALASGWLSHFIPNVFEGPLTLRYNGPSTQGFYACTETLGATTHDVHNVNQS